MTSNEAADRPAAVPQGSLARKLAVTAMALVAAWLAVRVILLEGAVVGAPQLIEWLAPRSGGALASVSGVRALKVDSVPSPALGARLGTAVTAAPLIFEPFYVAGLTARAAGRTARSIAFAEEAKRREPRAAGPRILLAVDYLRQARVADGIAEIDAALRLQPNGHEQLMEALFRLADDPRSRPALVRALAANPAWRPGFVAYSSTRGGASPALFSAMLGDRPLPPDQRAAEQEAVLNALLAKGDASRAYLAWVNFLPAGALDRVGAVYDANFRGLPGPRPFNWSLTNDENGTAEMGRNPDMPGGTALDVDYFGGERTIVARQALVLPPGAYRIGITAMGQAQSDFAGAFAWALTCLPGGTTLFERTIATPVRPARSIADFVVPAAGCGAQMIAILGVPGEVAALQEGQFGGIRVQRR